MALPKTILLILVLCCVWLGWFIFKKPSKYVFITDNNPYEKTWSYKKLIETQKGVVSYVYVSSWSDGGVVESNTMSMAMWKTYKTATKNIPETLINYKHEDTTNTTSSINK